MAGTWNSDRCLPASALSRAEVTGDFGGSLCAKALWSVRHDVAIAGTIKLLHGPLLADEQMAGAVKHQAALLPGCLGWHEPHVGSGNRLANRFCVGHVILLPFDVGLHVSRLHQSYGMAKCLQLARPMVRRGAGLNANQAWW